ncbi:LLM class F420-dependent oxidoreductase [Diaminobutyricimonas sp. TR449]|uniref:LLM class F420-dependent oxidoreductase n=1 Tax=Diaminobutyricimonas sp. TR449 TaxID=2708076 RepID=UPI001FBC12E5|nr:LLM class F420-dependent oxidoreductase [Diaminobutyricimonas sp. TR449]
MPRPVSAGSTNGTPPSLGRFGVWRPGSRTTAEQATGIEGLGYGTLWLGGSPGADLHHAEELLDATSTLTIATGIVNIWRAPVDEVAASFHRIEAKHPGRFLLGIGVGHPETADHYRAPYTSLVEYLDRLDVLGVPEQRRALAALGPRVLKLSAARTAAAHPYLTTPAHTRSARELIGPSTILAPEQKVMLTTDASAARYVGRKVAGPYLELTNYRTNLVRSGFTEQSLDDGGSDEVIDALIAHGEASYVAARLREHIEAGADHVAIQVLPQRDDPLPTLEALARELSLR